MCVSALSDSDSGTEEKTIQELRGKTFISPESRSNTRRAFLSPLVSSDQQVFLNIIFRATSNG